jgi:hypothetical protein
MIPYLLAALGGYLIGDSIGEDIEKFSAGGNLYRTKDGSIVSWNPKKLRFVKDSEKYNTSWGRLGDAIGEFDIKDSNKWWFGTLYELDDFDRKYWSGVKLKPDEMLFRYETYTTKVTNIRPVVKIKIDKGIIYFLKDLDADDDKNLVFETRGVKLKFLQLHEKIMQDIKGYLPYPLERMADGGVVGDAARVKSKNKTGVIMKVFKADDFEQFSDIKPEKHYLIKFVDGTQDTYAKSELELIKN